MSRFVRVTRGVVTERVDDEVLAYDGDRVYRFTGTGALVWDAIPRDGPARDVVAHLAARFDEANEVVSDVDAFVSGLVDLGLVQIAERPDLAYRRPDHVGWTADADGVLVVDLRDGLSVLLSSTGSRIWELVLDGVSRAELARTLGVEFDVDPDLALRSAGAFLDDLVERGLLEVA